MNFIVITLKLIVTMLDAYCLPLSALQGDSLINLHVSSSEPTVNINVLCISSNLVVWSKIVNNLEQFETPSNASTNGCNWPSVVQIPTSGLSSSLYIVSISSEVSTCHAYFVIKARVDCKSAILFVLSTSTWAAYNDWGGGCLYTGNHKVSLERPLAKGFLYKSSNVSKFR